ncbi:hypothetical protein GA0115246_112862 [Streptomyces sp. SolWspMP-sol7th]|nr:hypothetical protein GA0115246_112862 [Streptomyces sp. SolWspMP-sol7th]
MPIVRAVRTPSRSHSHVSARVRMTRSATMSIAVSRSSGSQSVPYGLRYRTSWRRAGPVVSWSEAEPLGHRRPRLTGEAGSPSICVTFSPLT